MNANSILIIRLFSILVTGHLVGIPLRADVLPGTKELNLSGDIADRLIDTADKFLLAQLANASIQRSRYWNRNVESFEQYELSIKPNREFLRRALGVTDARVDFRAPWILATIDQDAVVGESARFQIVDIRWPSFGQVTGRGLALIPKDQDPVADVIALGHCDHTPEQLCGLSPGVTPSLDVACRLAESGCRVFIPVLINREPKHNGITNREWLHRSAYEMGRTLTGYEINKVLSLVDAFQNADERPIGIIGIGDGGLVAWYAAAIDNRIDAACVSGACGDLENLWQQPLDRMVFSVANQFGDAELATLVAPRKLIVEFGTAPTVSKPDGMGGAPYRISNPDHQAIDTFAANARELLRDLDSEWLSVVQSKQPFSGETMTQFLLALSSNASLSKSSKMPVKKASIDPIRRHEQQFDEMDRHTQDLLRKSHWERQRTFWNKLDFSSLAAYQNSIEPFRHAFRHDVIGHFEIEKVSPNARTRLIKSTEKWKQYEVVLDVFDGLFAYGILTVPTDIEPSERRPVVVCQHGLEGRPQSVIGEQDFHYYKAFATQLAERGFVTFAPQNIYIFRDRFRTLQRKANMIGKTLFSIMVPQHQQIVDWLQTQPFVDPDRIAFYGLSYGGKTAMRVPPLVQDYCLSICSADFNEWVDKNASTLNPRSYVNSGEYEIFEWNLGHTFNYAEMAALIAPRPFMVERGHHDGVADDWTVAWEYARVRFLYAARLKIASNTEIEWFDGPHSIHGKQTFEFLHRHLKWPKQKD